MVTLQNICVKKILLDFESKSRYERDLLIIFLEKMINFDNLSKDVTKLIWNKIRNNQNIFNKFSNNFVKCYFCDNNSICYGPSSKTKNYVYQCLICRDIYLK